MQLEIKDIVETLVIAIFVILCIAFIAYCSTLPPQLTCAEQGGKEVLISYEKTYESGEYLIAHYKCKVEK